MSDPHVYPEAPGAPLSVPAAIGTPDPTFTPIEQLAAHDPTTPKIPKTMFIRVAMSGADCPGVTSATAPNFYLRADTGEAVLINDHAQPPNQTYPIFRRSGSSPADFIGEGSTFLESHNVFRLVIAFNDAAGDYAWRLGIWNSDAAAMRQFTWVVSGTLANTSQPWVHATYRNAVPAHVRFDALVGQTSAETAQPIEITNRGTGSVAITGVTPAIAAPYTIAGLPATLEPNPRTAAIVTVGFNAASTPGDIPARTFTFVTSNKPDPGPFDEGHNIELILSARTSSIGDIWTTKAPMPTNRLSLGLTTARNGKIYAVGGFGPGPPATRRIVEEYDPTTDTWATKATKPTDGAYFGLAAAPNGKLYAIGGWDFGESLAVVEEYDPATDSWKTKAPISIARQGLAAVGTSNGKIYAIGGVVQSGGGHPPLATVEEYDPATNRWTIKASMPTARSHLGLAAAGNGKLYAGGGALRIGSSLVATLEEYDPTTDTWTTKAPMPTARDLLALAAASNGKLYAVGGRNAAGQAVPTVEEYDPATNNWTTKAPMPTIRRDVGLAAAGNGKLYAIGGTNGFGALATVEEYTP